MDEQSNINNPASAIDTSSWNLPAGGTTVPTPLPQNQIQFSAPTAQVLDLSPQIQNLVNSIRFDATNSVTRGGSPDSALKEMFPDAGKIDTTTFVPIDATHELLNDGETWLPKYESYQVGVDNEARISRQQTNFERFSNTVLRLGSNTAKAPLDIASFVYGIGDAAVSGRFDALYDNSFSKWVDDATTKTNFNYKNYFEESQKNLGLNMYTLDKVGSGAEFTTRMIASEAIIAGLTGGASLPSGLARLGVRAGLAVDKVGGITRTGNQISRMFRTAIKPELQVASQGANVVRNFDRVTQGINMGARGGQWADRLKQLRFATTSPMYEAGFEAMHFRKEAESEFWDYYKGRGVEPTQEEINNFVQKMDGAANTVFGINMGILSVSNMAMFGDLLNVKNPLAKNLLGQWTKKNVFKIGTEVGEAGTYQALKSGFWNKTAAYVTPFVKGALIEGAYEEGSQGIASGTFRNYVASSYNPELMQKTRDYSSAFAKSFSDQFSSKAGQEEIVIGALIGGLFGGVGGARQTSREYSQQEGIAGIQNAGQEFMESFRGNAYTNEQLLSLFSHANRFQDLQSQADRAEKQGDNFTQARTSAESFISLLNAYHTVGKESEFTQMWSSMMQGMDNAGIAETTGLPIEQVDAFKQEQVQNMNQFAQNYAKGRETAQYLFPRNIGGMTEIDNNGQKTQVNNQNLIDAFSYNYGMSFFNEKFALETFDSFQQNLARITTNSQLTQEVGALGALRMADQKSLREYQNLTQSLQDNTQELQNLQDRLIQLQQGEQKTETVTDTLNLTNKIQAQQRVLEQVQSQKKLVWESMIGNFYTQMGKPGGYATQVDLNEFTDYTRRIQTSLDNATMKEEDRVLLDQLLNQFETANENFKSYQGIVNNLSDPKFTYKTYSGLFGSKRASRDKSMNDLTRETLSKIMESEYGSSLSTAMQDNKARPSLVTPEILSESQEESYVPSEEILSDLKTKTQRQSKLTPNEQQYYDSFKEQVDNFESVRNTDPLNDASERTEITDLKVKIRLKRQEIQDLQNGQYSDSLQAKIDQIQSEVEELENTLDNTPVQSSVERLKELFSKVYFENRDGDILTEGFAQFQMAMGNIADEYLGLYQAHGMGKSLFGASVNDLITLFENNVDPNRGGGMLNSTPLEGAKEAGSAIGASSAYSNGMFILVARAGQAIRNTNDIVSILVNDGVINENPEILDAIRQVFPNIVVDTYGNVASVAEQLSNASQVENNEFEEFDGTQLNKEIDQLRDEIENLEKEIQNLEESNQVSQTKVRDLTEARKYTYTQYEYTKRNGDVVTGWIEVRNNKTFFVNKNESIYLGEERNTVITSIPNLNVISEEGVIVEGNQVYANDKLYTSDNLDKSISQDEDGNYEVTLKARNGRPIIFTGNLADMIVYEHTLNKFLEQATNGQIEEAKRLAESEARIERKYEELISKTEDRSDKRSELEFEKQKAYERRDQQELELENKRIEEEARIEATIVKNQAIQNQVSEEIAKEQVKLENELLDFQGELSTEERIDFFTNRIQELQSDVNLNDSEISLLNEYRTQIELLNARPTRFDPDASYADQLDWVVNNIPQLGFESRETLATIQPPNQEDVSEYVELSKNTTRTKSENQRFSELREQLLPYNLAEGIEFDGMSLLNLIDLYNQVQDIEEQVETQISELPIEQFYDIARQVRSDQTSTSGRSGRVSLNYDGVVTEFKNGKQTISHVSLTTMLSKALRKDFQPVIKIKDAEGTITETIQVTVLNVEELGQKYDAQDNISVELTPDVQLEKPKGSTGFNTTGSIIDLLDARAYAITGQTNTYNLVYTQATDGNWVPMESEFEVQVDDLPIMFDRETANSLKQGDTVQLEFNPNDNYNKKLRKNQYVSKSNIYIRKNGKLVGVLKAEVEKKAGTESWDNLVATRRAVIEAYNTQSKQIELKVEGSYLGLPQITFNSEGQPNQFPIEESKVEAYGYIDENGQLQGDVKNVQMDNTQYIEPLKQLKKRVPIVAFNYAGKVYGFPIGLRPQSLGFGTEIDSILNDPTIQQSEKILKLNALLEANQMLNVETAITNQNFDANQIRQTLQDVQRQVDLTNSEALKNAEKSILIDMNDPFLTSKLILDLLPATAVQTVDVTDANQNPNIQITTLSGKGKKASEENKC